MNSKEFVHNTAYSVQITYIFNSIQFNSISYVTKGRVGFYQCKKFIARRDILVTPHTISTFS